MDRRLRNSIEYKTNFIDFLRMFERYGEKPAISWFTRNQGKYTKNYQELLADIGSLRNALLKRNLDNKHLAIVGENSYEWILVYLAAVSIGSVVVCIDVEQSEDNILNMIKTADSCAVFSSSSCLHFIAKEEDLVFCLDDTTDDERLTVKKLIEEDSGFVGTDDWSAQNVYDDQVAAIVYTSGTTKGAKPVMLSHKSILINAFEANLYADAGKCTFSFLPFCHTYGMTCAVLATFARGAELVLNGNTKTALRDLISSGAYSILTVPLTVEVLHKQLWTKAEQLGLENELRKHLKRQKLLKRIGIKGASEKLKELKESIFGTIQVIICGGAHLNIEIAENIELMGIQVLQGYGITECSPIVSINGNLANHLGTVGKPIPSCQVRIVEGEIQVSGPCVMNGYYQMPEETAEVLKEGWFSTGDLGEITREGYLKITGRRKNLIVFKNGKKVSPEAYEEKLANIPLIEEVVVYGAVTGESDDDVKIAVSVYPKRELSQKMSSYEILEELQKEIDRFNNTLPLYQQIQMIHIREEAFHKTATQKIKRFL